MTEESQGQPPNGQGSNAQGSRTLGLLGLAGSVVLVAAGLFLVSLGIAERERMEPPGTAALSGVGVGGGDGAAVEVRGTGITVRPLPYVARQGAGRRTFGVTLAAAGLGALLASAFFGRGSGAGARWISALAIAFGAYALFRLATGTAGGTAATSAEAREAFRLWGPLTGLAAVLSAARR